MTDIVKECLQAVEGERTQVLLRLIINDIIDIYEGKFISYIYYLDVKRRLIEEIAKENLKNSVGKTNFIFYENPVIISQLAFEYILHLKEVKK